MELSMRCKGVNEICVDGKNITYDAVFYGANAGKELVQTELKIQGLSEKIFQSGAIYSVTINQL